MTPVSAAPGTQLAGAEQSLAVQKEILGVAEDTRQQVREINRKTPPVPGSPLPR